jgi:hypothetical protein
MIEKIARIYVRVFWGAIVLWLLYIFLRFMYESTGIWGIAAFIAVVLFFIALLLEGDDD